MSTVRAGVATTGGEMRANDFGLANLNDQQRQKPFRVIQRRYQAALLAYGTSIRGEFCRALRRHLPGLDKEKVVDTLVTEEALFLAASGGASLGAIHEPARHDPRIRT